LATIFVGTAANASTPSAPVSITAVATTDIAGAVPQTIHANDLTLFLYDHQCKVIGSDTNGNEGVACADLYYGDDGSNIWLEGVNEILCQNSTGIVQCAGIHETAALCWVGGPPCDTNPGVCGARFGHTPCADSRVENGELVEFAGCSPDAWGDALDTAIVLPVSGKPIGGAGDNEATGHIGSLCP
jgi:hypothetical protein